MAEWAHNRKIGLCAVTVDHGLRAAARDEAAFAGETCRQLGIAHEVLRWDDWDGRGNLQQAARRARLDLIAKWARGLNIQTVALGHTMDDQAETVLMRLARGSGVDGLSGMAARRRYGAINVIRPLLQLRRADLRAMLSEKNFDWIEDPSNNDLQFDRVKARAALVSLADLGLDAAGLSKTAQAQKRARDALERLTQTQAKSICSVGESGDVLMAHKTLKRLDKEIMLRLMAHVLKWVASGDYRPRLASLESLLSAGFAKPTTLAGCLIGADHNGRVRISRELRAVAELRCDVGQLWDKRWEIVPPDAKDKRKFAVAPLGEAGLLRCGDWREIGLPKASLLASPAIWLGNDLVAAPFAGQANGWQIRLNKGADHFFASIVTH